MSKPADSGREQRTGKDKQRELAERWRATAKRLPDGDYAVAHDVCAVELLALLDAEGDGGAVAWVADLAPGVERPKEYMGIFTPYRDYADHLAKHPDYVVTPLYTHPARSGAVSDEDVEEACRKYYNCGHQVYPPVFEGMRAALEHFARRTP